MTTIYQNDSFRFTVTLKDEDDAAIALASIDTITMIYFDAKTGKIINSRGTISGGVYVGQDVKNTNQCTMHATSGLFTWAALKADAAMIDRGEKGNVELHKLLITVGYSTTKFKTEEFDIPITNLSKIGIA